MDSFATFSINDTQHTSIECCYAECPDYLNVLLSVIMLNAIMLSVMEPLIAPDYIIIYNNKLRRLFSKFIALALAS
jgi:hypothetical protein